MWLFLHASAINIPNPYICILFFIFLHLHWQILHLLWIEWSKLEIFTLKFHVFFAIWYKCVLLKWIFNILLREFVFSTCEKIDFWHKKNAFWRKKNLDNYIWTKYTIEQQSNFWWNVNSELVFSNSNHILWSFKHCQSFKIVGI